MRLILAYLSLAIAIGLFVVGILAFLLLGVLWKLVSLPDFWIALALQFSAAALFAALWWFLKKPPRSSRSAESLKSHTLAY